MPTSTPRADRRYDLVLFGATGFTGRLVADYLARKQVPGLRWALAGRNPDKLAHVRADLAVRDAALVALPILQADADDEEALGRVARETRVVCTTVGPYARHGRALVGACAEAGTDYCDITGEVQFIRDAIDRWDAQAKKTGARIVPTCGFDSIPSDLGTFLLHRHFVEQGSRLATARLYVEQLRGGFSGGTIASMLQMMDDATRDRELRSLLGDPYALLPDRKRDRGSDGADQRGVAWDAEAEAWTAPFVMASINARVVRRSNALLDFAYGRDFRYAEVTSFRRGPKGLASATALTAGLGGFLALAAPEATRKLLARFLPAPGTGPSAEDRARGRFRIRVAGTSAPGSDGKVLRADAIVEGRSDPGYGETCKMLGEAALCLAFDKLPTTGGLLTPAAAMGETLIARLVEAGMGFRVEAR